MKVSGHCCHHARNTCDRFQKYHPTEQKDIYNKIKMYIDILFQKFEEKKLTFVIVISTLNLSSNLYF